MTDSEDKKVRCEWCGDDPAYQAYHDEEWGVPVTAERELFEFLVLEGAQAGLSWLTILRKREGYREVFDDFDLERLARWEARRIDEALATPAIVRNRRKVESVVANARATLRLREEGPGLPAFLWSHVDGGPMQNQWTSHAEIPASTPLSTSLSRALKQRGFTFVGPTIIYAFMQAVGMVNDHLVQCHRHRPCAELGRRVALPRP